MSKITDIKLLRQQCSSKENQLRKLRWKIEEYEENKELPKLKKKYEGKYFKYNNGTTLTDRWWMYCHCKEVNNIHRFVFDTFETTPYQHEFKLNDEHGTHLCQIKITKKEYDAAAKKFLKLANKIIN